MINAKEHVAIKRIGGRVKRAMVVAAIGASAVAIYPQNKALAAYQPNIPKITRHVPRSAPVQPKMKQRHRSNHSHRHHGL